MPKRLLDDLALAVFEADDAVRLGLRGPVLRLRRAWPRSAGHLLLEFESRDGGIVPGQWMADRSALARVERRTPAANPPAVCSRVRLSGHEVLLQVGGADRRLPGLAALLRRPDAGLIVHRPERRAVVRLGSSDSCHYAKVVRPERSATIAAATNRLRAVGNGGFDMPELLDSDLAGGILAFAPLAGCSLQEWLVEGRSGDGPAAAGRALRALHDPVSMVALPGHDAEAEIGVLEGWLGDLAAYDPSCHAMAAACAGPVHRGLRDGASPQTVIHRDMHDKQVFVGPGERIGLLDFDLLARGEAALDVANMIGHFELRALQGLCPESCAEEATCRFLDGYEPSAAVRARLPAYLNATRLRLACVYAFRPRWGDLPDRLLDRVGTPSSLLEA